MNTALYRNTILELISQGYNTAPLLSAELQRRKISLKSRLTPKPVCHRKTHGPPLQQTLKYLSHNRQIVPDKATGTWRLTDRRTYHPSVSFESLIKEHSKTIPENVEKGVLLL